MIAKSSDDYTCHTGIYRYALSSAQTRCMNRLLLSTVPFARTFPTLAKSPNTSNNINKLLTSSNMDKITLSSLSIDWNCFMSVTLEELNPERQQKAREYARTRHRLLLIDLGIATAGILIVLFSGIGIWLRDV